MIIIKPPLAIPKTDKCVIFLAGTIDNGNSIDWQSSVEEKLGVDCMVLNPRRDEWDSSWEQSITNPKFKEQVEWELECLSRADKVFMYFAPGSQSPITLLELGLIADKDKLIVCCPDGFWRKGNVEVTCSYFGIPIFECIDDAMGALLSSIQTS